MQPATPIPEANEGCLTWSPALQAFASIFLVLHLAAVIIAPCATPPPRSHLAYSIAQVFEPYLSSTFLFHGYRFFAPNPGPGHLLRYEAVISDSQGQVTEGVFPDLDQQWPQLLYHRYFMIAERVWSDANIMPPPASGFVNEEHHREYRRVPPGRTTPAEGRVGLHRTARPAGDFSHFRFALRPRASHTPRPPKWPQGCD